MPSQPADLASLAQKILTSGPTRHLPAQRRIRILHGGTYLFDAPAQSTRLVWDNPPSLTRFYVPFTSLHPSIKVTETAKIDAGARILTLSTPNGSTTDRVIHFTAPGPATDKGLTLEGLVRIEFGAVDSWFEEDARVSFNPRSPFHRVDCLPSSLPIKVSVRGHLLAETNWSVHVHETGLPVRYYLPFTAVDATKVRKARSGLNTSCPYKGTADYLDVILPEGVKEELAWYYDKPLPESAPLAGLVCFYNEKVDIEVDGKKVELLKW